jgi:hypothetical protein
MGSLLLSLVVIWQYRSSPYFHHPVVDEEVFVDWALRIAEGEWIGREVFYFDPLFPYTLARLLKVFGVWRVVGVSFKHQTLPPLWRVLMWGVGG